MLTKLLLSNPETKTNKLVKRLFVTLVTLCEKEDATEINIKGTDGIRPGNSSFRNTSKSPES